MDHELKKNITRTNSKHTAQTNTQRLNKGTKQKQIIPKGVKRKTQTKVTYVRNNHTHKDKIPPESPRKGGAFPSVNKVLQNCQPIRRPLSQLERMIQDTGVQVSMSARFKKLSPIWTLVVLLNAGEYREPNKSSTIVDHFLDSIEDAVN